MVDAILKIFLFIIERTIKSEETKKAFYTFIENYNADNATKNANIKQNIEEQINELKGNKK